MAAAAAAAATVLGAAAVAVFRQRIWMYVAPFICPEVSANLQAWLGQSMTWLQCIPSQGMAGDALKSKNTTHTAVVANHGSAALQKDAFYNKDASGQGMLPHAAVS